MNKVCLVGRLTSDPQLYEATNGTKQTKFSVAVNRLKEGADFINCIAWNKQAELMCKYLKKGNQIAIEGRIQTGSYDDKDGNKRYTTDVIVENLTFIGNKKKTQEAPKEARTEENDPFNTIEFTDADLPF